MDRDHWVPRALFRRGLFVASAALLLVGSEAAVFVQGPSEAPTKVGGVVRLAPATAAALAAKERQAASVQLADGLAITVWATNKLVMNPLAIDVDANGVAFVGATQRSSQYLDTRNHPDWVPELHALKSTDDLRQFFRRKMATSLSAQNTWLPDENKDGLHDWRDLMVVPERVYRIADTNGDGVADTSTLAFAGLNDDVASDMLGSVMRKDDDLYVAAAPNVFRLRDLNKDGVFETKLLVSTGYSVHPSFSGHDLSALTEGPDGRIYWKVGEIGMNVVDKTGKRWAHPHTGAVLRSNPDGTDFEVFAYGVRNPQEMAFDDYGNLIAVDNDGDYPGETERVVYLTQGSDTGWRSTWQYGKYTDPDNNRYNVWIDEGLSKPWFEGQAAYILPPIAPYIAGPSGFAYNPGTALADRWKNHFFVTSFTGSAATARVMAFTLNPKGAGFSLGNNTELVRGVLSGGISIGPDGAMYLTDWVTGWGPTGDGRVWRLDSPEAAKHPMRAQVATLLRANFNTRSAAGLRELLRHDDQRVRRKAQFELVRRADRATFAAVAADTSHRLARVHALWGLGQLLRAGKVSATVFTPYLSDKDSEVRAQAANMLGDARSVTAVPALLPLVQDAEARVRFFAVQALGRARAREAQPAIVGLLAKEGDTDVYLRSAGIAALESIGDRAAVNALSTHASRAVRLAAVVTLRRLKDQGVARFLDDRDPLVVAEAARAINDEGGIPAALPALAAVLTRLDGGSNEATIRRALSANLRGGSAQDVQRVVAFLGKAGLAEALKIDAIATLGVWAAPSNLDRVDGHYLGTPRQADAAAARAAVTNLAALLDTATTPVPVKVAVIEAAAKIGAASLSPRLLAGSRADASPVVRAAALRALQMLKAAETADAVTAALTDTDATVRAAAISAMPAMPIPDAAKVTNLVNTIGRGSVVEAQGAITALGAIKAQAAVDALSRLADNFAAGTLQPALQLDLLEAMRASGAPVLLARLDQLKVGRALENLATTMPHVLRVGGDATRGRRTALEHPAAQCTRCHTIGQIGATVGPNLNTIGRQLNRDELLAALLTPSARVAPGYGVVSLTLKSGRKLDGVLKEESAAAVTIELAAGATERVNVAEIATRSNAVSAMPPMGALLAPREIRDVLEFLTGLQ
jgi:quinoprotein glucose dehydrogenase